MISVRRPDCVIIEVREKFRGRPPLNLNLQRRQLAGELAGPGPHPEDRMSIGLVLGGGAARGFAHIGVLRTLMAHGIRPDVITGTSIGAVIAGVYAARCLDDFEAWARLLTRRRVFGYLDFSIAG